MGTTWTVASVVTGAVFALGTLMWTERNVVGAWACFMASFFPMVIATLVWAPMANDSIWRISISGTIGAIVGSIVLIGITEIIHGRAQAGSSLSNQPIREIPLTEKFAQNVTSYGQQGGITAGTVNIGPQRLAFSPDLGNELLAKMSNKKKVIIRSIGGYADQAVASEIKDFLQRNGYEVTLTPIGMLMPPPDHKISLGESPDGYVLTVAPSAN